MTNSKFKVMKDVMISASANDPVWFAGYLFNELTERQLDELITLFERNDTSVEMCTRNGVYGALLPSGIFIYRR